MDNDQNVYDVIVIVIGAGPVGQNVADRACAADLRVAVVERELVGGECSYWASTVDVGDSRRNMVQHSAELSVAPLAQG